MERRNFYGQIIKGPRELSDDRFWNGEKAFDGEKQVDWKKFVGDNVDQNGFDLNYSIENDYIIPSGSLIIRFGQPTGKYTAPFGTEYEKLALPYKIETIEYHIYRVSVDTSVTCIVKKGIVGRNFYSDGGGVQFFHFDSPIYMLLKNNIISEVYNND